MKKFTTIIATAAICFALVGCQDMMFNPELSDSPHAHNEDRAGVHGTATISYALNGPNSIYLDRQSVIGQDELAVRLLIAGPNVHLFFPDVRGASIRLNTNHGTLRGSGTLAAGRASFDMSQINEAGVFEMPKEFNLIGEGNVRSTAAGKLVWSFD